jgi:hypothetical protein
LDRAIVHPPAGEAGQGFAEVADLVGALAARAGCTKPPPPQEWRPDDDDDGVQAVVAYDRRSASTGYRVVLDQPPEGPMTQKGR